MKLRELHIQHSPIPRMPAAGPHKSPLSNTHTHRDTHRSTQYAWMYGPINLRPGTSSLHSMGCEKRSSSSDSSCQLPRKTKRSSIGFATAQAAHSPCRCAGAWHYQRSRSGSLRVYVYIMCVFTNLYISIHICV